MERSDQEFEVLDGVDQMHWQLANLDRQRHELYAQLGEDLYQALQDMPSAREGREALFDSIASINRQIKDLQCSIESAAGSA